VWRLEIQRDPDLRHSSCRHAFHGVAPGADDDASWIPARRRLAPSGKDLAEFTGETTDSSGSTDAIGDRHAACRGSSAHGASHALWPWRGWNLPYADAARLRVASGRSGTGKSSRR